MKDPFSAEFADEDMAQIDRDAAEDTLGAADKGKPDAEAPIKPDVTPEEEHRGDEAPDVEGMDKALEAELALLTAEAEMALADAELAQSQKTETALAGEESATLEAAEGDDPTLAQATMTYEMARAGLSRTLGLLTTGAQQYDMAFQTLDQLDALQAAMELGGDAAAPALLAFANHDGSLSRLIPNLATEGLGEGETIATEGIKEMIEGVAKRIRVFMAERSENVATDNNLHQLRSYTSNCDAMIRKIVADQKGGLARRKLIRENLGLSAGRLPTAAASLKALALLAQVPAAYQKAMGVKLPGNRDDYDRWHREVNQAFESILGYWGLEFAEQGNFKIAPHQPADGWFQSMKDESFVKLGYDSTQVFQKIFDAAGKTAIGAKLAEEMEKTIALINNARSAAGGDKEQVRTLHRAQQFFFHSGATLLQRLIYDDAAAVLSIAVHIIKRTHTEPV